MQLSSNVITCSLIDLNFDSMPSEVSNVLTFLCFIVLLEGSPGVGKTSLVAALGRYSGHTVVRINLSEQVRADPNYFKIMKNPVWF